MCEDTSDDGENSALENQESEQEQTLHRDLDVSVRIRCVESALAPQEISLTTRVDWEPRKVFLTLKNDSNDAYFLWQDWVDAAMGFMKGYDDKFCG